MEAIDVAAQTIASSVQSAFAALSAPALVAIAAATVLLLVVYHVVSSPLVYKWSIPKDHQWKLYPNIDNVPPPFPNSWFGIMTEDELPAGKPKEVRCMGKTLVAFRDSTGKASVMDAYCPHLGANLADGEIVNGDCLRCPFHGWEFNGDGSVARVPYSESSVKVKARTYPVHEANGIIFVYFDASDTKGDMEPPWSVPVHPKVGRGKGYVFKGRVEHHLNAHLIEQPENAADASHFSVLHGAAVVPGLQWLFEHVWASKYVPSEDPSTKHIADLSVTHKVSFFKRFSLPPTTTQIMQIGPGVVTLTLHTPFGEVVWFECTTPQSALHQKIVHTCWAGPWVPSIIPLIAFKVMMIQLERDIFIWNRKVYIHNPPVVKEEVTIKSYRKWYSQFYNDASLKAKDALRQEAIAVGRNLDW